MKRPLALLVPFLAALAWRSGAFAREVVAILPFENLSGVEAAPATVLPLVTAALTKRGYAVVSGERVAQALEAGRVRYLDSLAPEKRRTFLAAVQADAVLFGAILTWADGEDPVVAAAFRLVDSEGSAVWGGAIGLSGGETEGLLGLGRALTPATLASKSLRRLFAGLPVPGRREKPVSGSRPLLLASARTYVSPALPKSGARIAILPLESSAAVREAPRIAGELLARRLAETGRFDVVEAADVRAALVAEKVRGIRGAGPETLRALGERLGTTLFFTGTIWSWRDGSSHSASSFADAEIDLALVEVAAGRVLWTSHLARRGEDYRALFQRGAVKSIVALADKMLGEMVASEKSAKRSLPSKGGS